MLDSIARDLTSNNRTALVARYDKRGAFFLGNWGAELVPFDSLSNQIYGSDWKPPARFAWHNVHIEALGPRTSIVYAQFVWWTAGGDSVLTSYTGVFVRDGRNWRIRSEHESPDLAQLKGELCPKQQALRAQAGGARWNRHGQTRGSAVLRGRSAVSRFLLVSLVAACVASSLGAQATTATLQGTVTTSDGTVLPGAEVVAWSREIGTAHVVLADSRGVYRLLGLDPGLYDVTARAVGFRALRQTGVELIVGDEATLDFVLEPGAVELDPVVVQAASSVPVERLNVSTPVLEREIERLPLNTRDVLALASIAPGVRTFAPEAGRSAPAAGALSTGRFVNLYVDGVEWKGLATGALVGAPGSGSLMPQEGIREYRVSLNPYDAEYTRGASWVISAVTHQGSNTLHGSIFGFDQNRDLVAQGTFQRTRPDYQRKQVGANLRGSLIKDRLFFAISYEGQLTDNFIDVVPGRPPADSGIWDQYAGTFRAPFRNHMAMARLTVPRGRHTVDAIWTTRRLSTESAFGAKLSRDAGVVSTYRVSSVQLRDRYASPSLVNEASLYLLRNDEDDSPLAPGPTFVYPSIQIGRNDFPLTIAERHIGFSDKVYAGARFGGEHSLKSGIELTRVDGRGYQPTSMDGFFRFLSDTSTQPQRGTIGVGFLDSITTNDAHGTIDGWLVGGYLQDQWRPMPSLIVTAGVRYDAEIGTLNQNEVAPWASDTTLRRAVGERYLNSGDRQTDLDNIAPRVAVAWDLFRNGRTSLRAGYGVMYDRVPVFGAFFEKISWGWRTYTFLNPGTTDPAELRRRVVAGTGGAAVPPNLVLLPDRLDTPANHQWSAGIGRRLSAHVTLNVDYLHQHLHNLPVTVNVNTVDSATGQRRLTGRYGDIIVWGSFGDARFHGIVTSLQIDRAPTRISLAYTLGWAESEFGGQSTNGYPDSAAYSMQRSTGDERHRLVLSGLTDLPLGLQLSTIAVAASPSPFAVTVGTDVNKNGSLNDDWPNGIRTWRRDGWGYWYRTVDIRLGRAFSLPSGHLIVTADVFNLFNWANHSEYQTKQNLLDFAEPVGDYLRRQAQVGVRYEF